MKKNPLLKTNNFITTLEPVIENLSALNFTAVISETNILNLKWEIMNKERKAFETPKDFINAIKRGSSETTLEKYIQFPRSAGDPMLAIKVPSNGKIVFKLWSVILTPTFNYIDADVLCANGILGLGERVTHDLFLKDGVYGFWNRDAGTPVNDGSLPS